MKKHVLIALAAGLAACQSAPKVVSDKHTGETVAYGAGVSAYAGAFDSMRARPFHSSKGSFGIQTTYSNYGWIFIHEAWSHGRQLAYVPGATNVTMCAGGGGCITQESGVIAMTESEFRAAARDGFEFELLGRNGRVAGKVSAAAFQSALKPG